MTDDEVRAYLEENGYPDHVVRGGRDGLLKNWRRFVDEVEQGYPYGLHDYRNDLDGRGIIELLGLGDQVAAEDDRLRPMLVNTTVRVWESGPGEPFWDFGYPFNASVELLEDLQAEGLA